MSVESSNPEAVARHVAGTYSSHGHADGHIAGHSSVQSYLMGFGLSVVLTAVPFVLVMTRALPVTDVVPSIVALALVQMVVHLVYFLHMSNSPSQTWNNAAFVFTVVIVGILVSGSLWIMYHLNMNMMPGMMPSG